MDSIIIKIHDFDVLISKCDYERISVLKWRPHYGSKRQYFVHSIAKPRQELMLHRFIMNATKGTVIDHINGNTLDNRRENLRVCSHSENMKNSKKRSNGKCPYKGVYFNKHVNKWNPQIKVDGKRISLGYYLSAEEARNAYNEASRKYHGEFGRISYFFRRTE
jgi:hypothetical protein